MTPSLHNLERIDHAYDRNFDLLMARFPNHDHFIKRERKLEEMFVKMRRKLRGK